MSGLLQRMGMILAFMGVTLGSAGQHYPNWLQYLFNHQSVNPAYTAIGENLGFFVMNRSQLTGLSPADYSHQLSFHSPIFNQFNGAGFDMIADRADSLAQLSLFTNYSYELLIDEDIRLRMGGTFGLAHTTKILKEAEEKELTGNFGIGAFIYSPNGFFSFSIPRLIKNNAANLTPEERILQENRLFFFSTAALFPISEGVMLKPQLFYAIPFGKSSQMDLSFNLMLKEKTWVGLLYTPGQRIGAMAEGHLYRQIRMALATHIGRDGPTGKTVAFLDLSLSYGIDIYGRGKKPVNRF